MSLEVSYFDWNGVNALNWIYIGRKWKDLPGSVLQNKYKIGRDGTREEVIEKYRQWLWKEVKKGMKGEGGKVWEVLNYIKEDVKEGKQIFLMCWCKPKACHGDVVKSCIEWMIKEGY